MLTALRNLYNCPLFAAVDLINFRVITGLVCHQRIKCNVTQCLPLIKPMWTEPLFQNSEPTDKHWQYTNKQRYSIYRPLMMSRQNCAVAIIAVLNLPLLYEYSSMTVIEIVMHYVGRSSTDTLSYNVIVIKFMYMQFIWVLYFQSKTISVCSVTDDTTD